MRITNDEMYDDELFDEKDMNFRNRKYFLTAMKKEVCQFSCFLLR